MSRMRAATSTNVTRKVRPLRPTAPKRVEAKRPAKRQKASSFSPAVHRAAMLFSLATTLAVGSLVLIAVAPQPLKSRPPAALTASHGANEGEDAKLSTASLSPEQLSP